MDRIYELVKILEDANKKYYEDNTETMTNKEYDDLYNELLELEKKYNIVLPNSPTKKVGYKVKDILKKVKHDVPMLSLNKTKDIEELKKFINGRIGVLSYKLDGLTVVIKYENGKVSQAITRGNGDIGEDITHNIKYFKNLPKVIDYKGNLTLRGEAIITYSEFKNINKDLDIDMRYKNPRNLCSGTVRQLKSKISIKRNVIYLPFFIVNVEKIDFNNSKVNSFKWLAEQGFEIVNYRVVNIENLEEAILKFKSEILDSDIPSDGLVLTYDDINYSKSLGVTSKFPRDSIALKWQDETKETKLIEIQWNTSRTGLINPTAIFEPVELEGTIVSKASLHNLSTVENLKLGIGDIIKVYKANMIIPQVLENLTCSNNFVLPEVCSVCKCKVEIVKQKDTKFIFCINSNCRAQKLKSLIHYVSRDAMNIEGFSECTLETFIENGFIKDYLDIYSLDKFKNQIISLKNFGEKSYKNLIESIEKSKKCNLENFIYALGINHVGVSNAKLLCKNYNYDFNKIKEAKIEELMCIEGFGNVISKSIYDYFNNEENINLLNRLIKYLNIVKIDNIENSFENIIFVITGTLEKFKSRKELEKLIESKGGKVLKTVTSDTSYLLNNNIESNSSKNKRAKELGIPIINEDEFMKLLN